MDEWTRARHRHRRVAGTRVDEDVAARIGRHAADFAEVDVVGKRQRIRRRIEVDRRRVLSSDRGCERNCPAKREREFDQGLHGALPQRPALGRAGVGCRMYFCTRHDSISPRISSFGLRQSILWTTWKPGGILPGLPNLPMTVPSISAL